MGSATNSRLTLSKDWEWMNIFSCHRIVSIIRTCLSMHVKYAKVTDPVMNCPCLDTFQLLPTISIGRLTHWISIRKLYVAMLTPASLNCVIVRYSLLRGLLLMTLSFQFIPFMYHRQKRHNIIPQNRFRGEEAEVEFQNPFWTAFSLVTELIFDTEVFQQSKRQAVGHVPGTPCKRYVGISC